MESKRARFALVNNLSITIYQVQAIRPTGVSLFRNIVEAIDHGRELDAQFPHATVGHVDALVQVLGAREYDFILHISLHLPDIAGVSFQDVNRVERDVVTVFLIQLVKGRNLPPKRRSSVAAEDEHD